MAATKKSTPYAAQDITPEELSLVRSYLLLTFIHKVFERDCRVIGKSGLFKTPQLYMELVSTGAKRTSLMLQEVNRELDLHNLKVITILQDVHGVVARYNCRDCPGELNMMWPGFRREMMLRMRAYLGLANDFSILSREDHVEQLAMTL